MEEKAAREKYAQRAVHTLGEAIEAGYKDVEHIKNDADLDAIREHPKCKQLVEELEKRAKEPKEPAPPAAKPSEKAPAGAK